VHDRDSGLILGLQAVGAGVAELTGEFALALEMAAALKGLGRALHL